MSDFSRKFNVYLDRETLKPVLVANPFLDSFTRDEIGFYDLSAPYDSDGVKVNLVEPRGRLDDYLNANWRANPGIKAPVLYIDGKVWMSLTFMEIQSAYIPITMAAGVLGTAGLGLGYFALRAASSPDVEEVHVYELEPRVIKYFTETFRGRPELDKITIHNADVRKAAIYDKKKRGPSFDFFFMDVYRTLLPDEVIEDIHLFQQKADVQDYRFWGQEMVVLDSLMNRERPRISELERAYFAEWKETPMSQGPDEEDLGKMSDLYNPQTDEEYRLAVLEPLGYLRG